MTRTPASVFVKAPVNVAGGGNAHKQEAMTPRGHAVCAVTARDHTLTELTGAFMSNTPHTLAEEFPGQTEAIHNLKISDAHFAKLLLAYDEVNDEVHRAETKIAPISPTAESDLRKKRLQIKDAISKALSR